MSVPTVPGYYWLHWYGEWEVARVVRDGSVWLCKDAVSHVFGDSAEREWGHRLPSPDEEPVYGVSWSSMDFQCLGCGAASDMVEVCAHEDGCAHGGSGYRTLPSPARLAALEELAAKEPVEMAEGWARCHYCHSLVGDICLHSPDCPWLRAQPAPEAG